MNKFAVAAGDQNPRGVFASGGGGGLCCALKVTVTCEVNVLSQLYRAVGGLMLSGASCTRAAWRGWGHLFTVGGGSAGLSDGLQPWLTDFSCGNL